jgi:hypothetical protein
LASNYCAKWGNNQDKKEGFGVWTLIERVILTANILSVPSQKHAMEEVVDSKEALNPKAPKRVTLEKRAF